MKNSISKLVRALMASLVLGLAIGLAFLTRLAGVSLYVTVAITILLLSLPLRRALRYMGIVFASGLPFLLGWLTYTLTAAGALANRQLAYHPLPPERWFDALKILLSWLAHDMVFRMLPLLSRLYSFLSLLLIPVLMIALYQGWTAWRGREVPDGANISVARAYARQNPGGFSLAFSLAIHILIYLLFLFLSISLFDASPPLDDRLFSMVYTPLIVLSCSALAWIWGRTGRRTALGRWLFAGVLFVLVAVNASDGGSRVALYDQRETFESARETMPIGMVAAVAQIGDGSCLEPLATAIDRTTDLWLKDQLLSALTAIVRRERLTRRHAVVKRLLAKHPALADALAPRQ